MAMPDVNDEAPSKENERAKPAAKPKNLSNKELATILNRVADLMLQSEDANVDTNTDAAKTKSKSAVQKPYPTEHAARQADPAQYTEIRRKNNAFGPGIHAIYGIKDGKTEVQSLRFDAAKFTPAEARKWLAEHNYKAGSLEGATGAVEKQANIVDLLISIIHRHFTEEADLLYGNGNLNQEERIGLSNAIGSALDTFNACIDKDSQLAVLRTRSHFADATGIGKQLATCEMCGKEYNNTVEVEPEAEVEDKNEPENEAEVEYICPTCVAALTKSDSEVTIFAKADERQIAYGIAYPAQPLGWSDSQGDWISVSEIELMAHNYMLKSRQYDIMHQRLADPSEARIVESYIAPVDFTIGAKHITKGSWVVATYFPKPEAWQAVKNGIIKAYSIRGHGKRKPISTNIVN